MADTTVDIQEIIDSFGSYYLDSGQNEQSLRMRPFEQFGTQDAFTLVPTEDTILRMSSIEVGELLQQYQDDYTPKGEVAFAPVEIPLTQVKIDNEFNPNKLMNSWLGFLASNKTDRSTWPFIRWFIEAYLLKQVDHDLELKAIYKGEKAVIVAGTASTAIGSMNGLKKQINAGITAGDIVTINTGAAAADPKDFCVQIEEFCAEIPEIYWDREMKLNMSRSLAKRYMKGRELLYNLNYAMKDDLAKVDQTNISVVGRASHTGDEKIWATLPGNYVLGVKGFGNKNMFEIEKAKRKVAVFSDWWMGIGYIMADQIFTNDQNLA